MKYRVEHDFSVGRTCLVEADSYNEVLEAGSQILNVPIEKLSETLEYCTKLTSKQNGTQE